MRSNDVRLALAAVASGFLLSCGEPTTAPSTVAPDATATPGSGGVGLAAVP
ncbi:MAG: hypothetical protein ACREM1_00640 [Longimicrobiales bacterium]